VYFAALHLYAYHKLKKPSGQYFATGKKISTIHACLLEKKFVYPKGDYRKIR